MLRLRLQDVPEQGAEDVEICADSELVVRQIQGRYRVKHPDLKPLYQRAKSRIESFRSFRIVHVRREMNKDADRLVNRALDAADTSASATS